MPETAVNESNDAETGRHDVGLALQWFVARGVDGEANHIR